jgi:hypothetical protein
MTGTSVSGADTDWIGSAVFDAVDVAVTVTLPAGAVMGAVNVTATPLAVWVELNTPQGAVVHVAVQSTPAAATSFVIVAVKLLATPAMMDVGGNCVNTIEMAGRTVTVEEAVVAGTDVDAAVTVTVPPAGTVEGAV